MSKASLCNQSSLPNHIDMDLRQYQFLHTRDKDGITSAVDKTGGNNRFGTQKDNTQAFVKSIICEIAALEDEEEKLSIAIDNNNATILIIAETKKELKKALCDSIGDHYYLQTNSELYDDLSFCIEEIRLTTGADHPLKYLDDLQTINGNTYLIIDTSKVSGPDGLISLLKNASDIISLTLKRNLRMQQENIKRQQLYYKLWTKMISNIEDPIE